MNIAFWDTHLNERGTTVAMFDYAYHNQTILNNKSFIFYHNDHEDNKNEVINKFKKEFIVHGTKSMNEVDKYLTTYNISHIYIIKYGINDGTLSKVAINCIHCVFSCSEPHGEIYSAISPWIRGGNLKYPIVPHMINLPINNKNLREKLNISNNAIVFGGYGGKGSFSINFVHKVVYLIALNNPQIYFLFANFHKFCRDLPNIIHLPMITDLKQKVEFINTTDAMLHARVDGETFGISIGEFSSKNKPVIAMKIGDLAHVHLLGNKGIWYNDEKSLYDILTSFKPELNKDWNAYDDFTPEKVMNIFKEVYLK